MTSIISKIETIDSLHIRELPDGKSINVARAVRVKNQCLFITNAGDVYTSLSQGWAHAPGETSKRMVTALYKLGAITYDDMEEHNAACEARVRRREVDWAAVVIEEAAKNIGIILTDQQMTAVLKAKSGAA